MERWTPGWRPRRLPRTERDRGWRRTWLDPEPDPHPRGSDRFPPASLLPEGSLDRSTPPARWRAETPPPRSAARPTRQPEQRPGRAFQIEVSASRRIATTVSRPWTDLVLKVSRLAPMRIARC